MAFQEKLGELFIDLSARGQQDVEKILRTSTGQLGQANQLAGVLKGGLQSLFALRGDAGTFAPMLQGMARLREQMTALSGTKITPAVSLAIGGIGALRASLAEIRGDVGDVEKAVQGLAAGKMSLGAGDVGAALARVQALHKQLADLGQHLPAVSLAVEAQGGDELKRDLQGVEDQLVKADERAKALRADLQAAFKTQDTTALARSSAELADLQDHVDELQTRWQKLAGSLRNATVGTAFGSSLKDAKDNLAALTATADAMASRKTPTAATTATPGVAVAPAPAAAATPGVPATVPAPTPTAASANAPAPDMGDTFAAIDRLRSQLAQVGKLQLPALAVSMKVQGHEDFSRELTAASAELTKADDTAKALHADLSKALAEQDTDALSRAASAIVELRKQADALSAKGINLAVKVEAVTADEGIRRAYAEQNANAEREARVRLEAARNLNKLQANPEGQRALGEQARLADRQNAEDLTDEIQRTRAAREQAGAPEGRQSLDRQAGLSAEIALLRQQITLEEQAARVRVLGSAEGQRLLSEQISAARELRGLQGTEHLQALRETGRQERTPAGARDLEAEAARGQEAATLEQAEHLRRLQAEITAGATAVGRARRDDAAALEMETEKAAALLGIQKQAATLSRLQTPAGRQDLEELAGRQQLLDLTQKLQQLETVRASARQIETPTGGRRVETVADAERQISQQRTLADLHRDEARAASIARAGITPTGRDYLDEVAGLRQAVDLADKLGKLQEARAGIRYGQTTEGQQGDRLAALLGQRGQVADQEREAQENRARLEALQSPSGVENAGRVQAVTAENALLNQQLALEEHIAQVRFLSSQQGQQFLQAQVATAQKVKQLQAVKEWQQLVAEQGKFGAALDTVKKHIDAFGLALPIGFGAAVASITHAGSTASPVAGDTLAKSFTLVTAVIGRDFVPVMIRVSGLLQDFAHWWENLSKETRTTTTNVALLGTGVAGAALVLGKLAGVIGMLVKAIGFILPAAAPVAAGTAGGGAAAGAAGAGAVGGAGAIGTTAGGVAVAGGTGISLGTIAALALGVIDRNIGIFNVGREALRDRAGLAPNARHGVATHAVRTITSASTGGFAWDIFIRPLLNRSRPIDERIEASSPVLRTVERLIGHTRETPPASARTMGNPDRSKMLGGTEPIRRIKTGGNFQSETFGVADLWQRMNQASNSKSELDAELMRVQAAANAEAYAEALRKGAAIPVKITEGGAAILGH